MKRWFHPRTVIYGWWMFRPNVVSDDENKPIPVLNSFAHHIFTHASRSKTTYCLNKITPKQRRESARAFKVHRMWATMIPFGRTRNASPFGVTHVGAHVHQQPKRQSYSSQGHWEGLVDLATKDQNDERHLGR